MDVSSILNSLLSLGQLLLPLICRNGVQLPNRCCIESVRRFRPLSRSAPNFSAFKAYGREREREGERDSNVLDVVHDRASQVSHH